MMPSSELLNPSLPDNAALQRLAARINLSLLKVFRLQAELQRIREELALFETEYFSALHQKLHTYLPLLHSRYTKNTSPLENTVASVEVIESLIRQLYRRLARTCHPDVSRTSPPDAMQTINQAYRNKELGSLIMLYQRYLTPFTEEQQLFSLQDMQYYLSHINELAASLQAEIDMLRQSDAYRLQHTLLIARLQGRDVIDEVAEHLRKQLCLL